MNRFFLFIGVILLVVVGYMFWPTSEESVQVDVPFGPFSEEGVLTSTGISLVRRGSHIFTMSDGTELFAESSTVNLQESAGKRVKVTGEVVANSSPKYLPLITVTAVELLEEDDSGRSVTAVADVTFSVPTTWPTGTTGTNKISFSGTGADLLLSVERIAAKANLPAGTPIRIAGKNSVRQPLADGSLAITIPLSDAWVVLTFGSSNEARMAADQILSSIAFADAQTSSTSSSSIIEVTGSGSGVVCGGPAGVLCPSGFYCAIVDFSMNTGVCKKTR